MATFEEQVRRQMEQDLSAAFSVEYPRTFEMRRFAKQSKILRKLGVKGQRPKAAQRKKQGS